jgi:hypothetical protein
MLAAAGIEQGLSGRQVRQRRATSLADEIEIENVRAQAEAFANVAGEAWTKISSAGADDEGVDFVTIGSAVVEGAFSGLCSERGGMFHIAVVENVGSDIERFIDTVENKVSSDNAVITGEDFFDDGAGTGVESAAEVGG